MSLGGNVEVDVVEDLPHGHQFQLAVLPDDLQDAGVGRQVNEVDDRSDFASPSRFPDCNVIAEDFTVALRDLHFSPATYVVVITRGHEHDVDCLIEVLKKRTLYVGLIGSRRRVRFVLEMLAEQGFSPKRLK